MALLALCGIAAGEASAQERTGPAVPVALEEIPTLLASDDGRPAAIEAIRGRATELGGTRATLWIQLLALVRRTSPEAGALAARAVLRADADERLAGADLVERGLEARGEGLQEGDAGPLLALAAHLAERDDPARAAALRERLLERYSDAPEAPEAMLRLARFRAGPEGNREGAIELLESLIVEHPEHPIVPDARRLLQQLRARGG